MVMAAVFPWVALTPPETAGQQALPESPAPALEPSPQTAPVSIAADAIMPSEPMAEAMPAPDIGVLFRITRAAKPAADAVAASADTDQRDAASTEPVHTEADIDAAIVRDPSPVASLEAIDPMRLVFGIDDEPPQPPSYLFATIHFGSEAEQGINYADLAERISSSKTFVNEIDGDAPWLAEYADYRWMAVDSPLSRMIGRDSFDMARALLPSQRVQDLERSKPWAVLALLEARGESGHNDSMDSRLQRIAAEHGLPIVHLETMAEQLQALDCVPANEQAEVLRQRLAKPWVLTLESDRAMRFYRSQNLMAWMEDLDRLDGLDEYAKPIEHRARLCLLEARNQRWLPIIEGLLQQGPSFIAVGAMHIAGPDGLVAALRRAGWRVEAESFSPRLPPMPTIGQPGE